MQHRIGPFQDGSVQREGALRRGEVGPLDRLREVRGGHQAPRLEAFLQAPFMRGRIGQGHADAFAAAETAHHARVPVPQQRIEDRAGPEPGEVHAAHRHPALTPLQMEIVAIEECRAPVGLQVQDVQDVPGHHRIAHRPETAPPGPVLPRPGRLPVIAQQPQRRRRMHARPVPQRSRGRRHQLRCAHVQLAEQVVRDHAQPRGLRRTARRPGRIGHRLHARPAPVLPRQRPDVGVQSEAEAEVVRDVLEEAAGAFGRELERRVDAVEGEPVRRGPAGVVLAHPRHERDVRLERAEAVREPLGHDGFERSGAVLDVVVDGERGHTVRFERERAEAGVGELREQLIADRPERGLAVVGLAEGDEAVGGGDEIAEVLSHGLKRIVERSVEGCTGAGRVGAAGSFKPGLMRAGAGTGRCRCGALGSGHGDAMA